ncbi:MAG: hypothetical protein RIC93_13835, partial [Alphaproteobacteria bacterium]
KSVLKVHETDILPIFEIFYLPFIKTFGCIHEIESWATGIADTRIELLSATIPKTPGSLLVRPTCPKPGVFPENGGSKSAPAVAHSRCLFVCAGRDRQPVAPIRLMMPVLMRRTRA